MLVLDDFDFGDKVKDKFTVFEGIVIAKLVYFTGCNKIAVQGSQLKEDGRTSSPEFFDVGQVDILEKKAVTLGGEGVAVAEVEAKRADKGGGPGGPMSMPEEEEVEL